MFKTLLATIAALFTALGLMSAVPAPASAGGGCVTIREARTVLEDEYQRQTEIERGWDDVGVKVDRKGDTMWRTYTPCVRPGHRDTWVEVIYFRNRAGVWKSFFWIWSLASPYSYRTTTGEWSGMRGR